MELWVKPEPNVNTGKSVIICKTNSYKPAWGGTGIPMLEWYIMTATWNMHMFIELYPHSTTMLHDTGSGSIVINTWMHITTTMTCDGIDSTNYLYINGDLRG